MDGNREDTSVSDETVNSQRDLFEDCSPADINMENCAASTVIDMDIEDIPWRGTPLEELCTNIGKDPYPPVKHSSEHTVLFKVPIVHGLIPKPYPSSPVDVWDKDHVRMPHSSQSLYPITETDLQRRWELIKQALSSSILSSHQLEAAILHYNSKYSQRWDFVALHKFFSDTLEEEETEYFFASVLPKLIQLALSLPSLVTTGVPLLRKCKKHSISLSQQQISCLLANAFFCTFPRRNTSRKVSEYNTYPDINFSGLFTGDASSPSLQEKLKCLMHYFQRVCSKVPDGVVTFSRNYIPPSHLPHWSKETARLPRLHVSSSGTIEDQGHGMLQMDFANKYIGGGVLGYGCVQEEIRFVICPELIVARLFTECLDDTESLIITGCERYSKYEGYADSFRWVNNINDKTPRDSFGRRYCTLVAVDALYFRNANTQYTVSRINRELNKAYAGFSWGVNSGCKAAIATGNWGCGAFRGDASLKALLQLMVAGKTRRDLAYFTFGDTELRDKLADMHSFLVGYNVTVGQLWNLIVRYSVECSTQTDLYQYLYQAVIDGKYLRTNPVLSVENSSMKKIKDSSMSEAGNSISKPEKHDTVKKQEAEPQHLQEEAIRQKPKDVDSQASKPLTEEEIQKAAEEEMDDLDQTESKAKYRPVEGKTYELNDKELCLKKLSDSWSNLADSRKDFEAAVAVDSCSKQSETSKPKPGAVKRKISDYFPSSPKV